MQLPASRWQRPSLHRGEAAAARMHCPIDNWDYDARYTEGTCPICGWRPEAVGFAAPLWMRTFQKVDWELAGLFMTVVLLVVLGILVERAAGLTAGDLGGFLAGR